MFKSDNVISMADIDVRDIRSVIRISDMVKEQNDIKEKERLQEENLQAIKELENKIAKSIEVISDRIKKKALEGEKYCLWYPIGGWICEKKWFKNEPVLINQHVLDVMKYFKDRGYTVNYSNSEYSEYSSYYYWSLVISW